MQTGHPVFSLLLCLFVSGVVHAGPRGPSPDQVLGVLAHRDLAAVQRPIFSTVGKLELGAQVVTIPSDPYVMAVEGSVFATWYLTERWGVEALLAAGNGWETNESTRLDALGVQVDSYTPRFIGSANVQWTPIYAKLSLLGLRVVHFDTSLTGGLGAFVARRTLYNAMEAGPEADRFNDPLSLDVGLNQRYYFRVAGRMMAFRVDARDYLYLLRTLDASTMVKHNWYFGVGVSWFLALTQDPGGDNG